MDLEQFRLRAEPLRHLLAKHSFPLSHNKALDLLAALPGLRNWPEVRSFSNRIESLVLDDVAAARLARRITRMKGPELSPQVIVQALTRVTAPLTVWPDGPRPGIYICTDSELAAVAIEKYVERSGGKPFYSDSVCSDHTHAIELGEYGIFSRGLALAPTGTLVVTSLELTQDNWDDATSRMTAAWNAVSSDQRVLVVCTTESPGNVFHDIALLTRSPDQAVDYVDPYLVGIVRGDGLLVEQSPFVPPRQRLAHSNAIPAPQLALPDAVASQLMRAVRKRPYGALIAGMFTGALKKPSEPLQVVAAMLPHLAHLGPMARTVPHQWNPYDPKTEVPATVLSLPRYSSVAGAIADGAKVILLECSANSAAKVIGAFGNDALFIVHAKAMGVGRAFTHTLGVSGGDEASLADSVVATICVGSVRGKHSKPLIWDMYRHVDNLEVPEDGDSERAFELRRVIRWDDQVVQFVRDSVVSKAAVRKDFPYLPLPKDL